jgi:PAS domain S-box-containing protein
VASGREAIVAATSGADLVLLDVRLPDLNGFDVCRALRQQESTRQLPIVHLTAFYTRDPDKLRALDSGADAYLVHPVHPAVLVATVNAFIRARKAEEALVASEAEFMAVFDRSPGGIALLDDGLRFIDVNPGMCGHLGRPEAQLLGKHLSMVMATEAESALASASGALASSGTWVGTLPVLRPDGTVAQVEWHLSPARPHVWLAITVDVTHRRDPHAEREWLLARERAAREEAERANQSKDLFLAVLSHELRTPLNVIVGWAQVLKTTCSDDAHVRQAIAAIERNADVQNQLIADLLDVSRITSGKLSLDRDVFAPADAIDAALASLDAMARERRVAIVRRDAPQLGAVRWDRGRLTQVVWNLVGNALKFSDPGGTVLVTLHRRADTVIVLEVSDHGRGIAPDFLPSLFNRFTQQHVTGGRQEGLGLGLAVVKHLVDAHGDRVEAESAGDGQGATFRVIFSASSRA